MRKHAEVEKPVSDAPSLPVKLAPKTAHEREGKGELKFATDKLM